MVHVHGSSQNTLAHGEDHGHWLDYFHPPGRKVHHPSAALECQSNARPGQPRPRTGQMVTEDHTHPRLYELLSRGLGNSGAESTVILRLGHNNDRNQRSRPKVHVIILVAFVYYLTPASWRGRGTGDVVLAWSPLIF